MIPAEFHPISGIQAISMERSGTVRICSNSLLRFFRSKFKSFKIFIFLFMFRNFLNKLNCDNFKIELFNEAPYKGRLTLYRKKEAAHHKVYIFVIASISSAISYSSLYRRHWRLTPSILNTNRELKQKIN
jgi:hypothetical protein